MNSYLKDRLRLLHHALQCVPARLLSGLGQASSAGAPIQFVAENADWAIRWVGEHIRDEINRTLPLSVGLTHSPHVLRNKVVHFGSQYMWLTWGQFMAPNQYVVSFFHGKPDDGPDVARHIDSFMQSVPRIGRVITGASIIEQRLLSWGVPREKLVCIPIGVDTQLFVPATSQQRQAARKRFDIPDHAVVVGSFQKDGAGWDDGAQPKLIKGPDLLVEALAELSKHRYVFAFLTGPARGYVKQRLSKLGIPFVHTYVQSHAELVACYHALDLYLVSSREEGGPMGLMESMASGVPVVSTPVGMAVDLIEHGKSGGLVSEFSGEALATASAHILDLADKTPLHTCARQTVMRCDWRNVAEQHYTLAYRPLLGL